MKPPPATYTKELAEWLTSHIHAGLNTRIKRWQWDLVTRCWGLDRVDFPQRCITSPEWADSAYIEIGAHTEAKRQLPRAADP